jgi:hypothetical protein
MPEAHESQRAGQAKRVWSWRRGTMGLWMKCGIGIRARSWMGGGGYGEDRHDLSPPRLPQGRGDLLQGRGTLGVTHRGCARWGQGASVEAGAVSQDALGPRSSPRTDARRTNRRAGTRNRHDAPRSVARPGHALSNDFGDGRLTIVRPEEPVMRGDQPRRACVMAVCALGGQALVESSRQLRGPTALRRCQPGCRLAQRGWMGPLLPRGARTQRRTPPSRGSGRQPDDGLASPAVRSSTEGVQLSV